MFKWFTTIRIKNIEVQLLNKNAQRSDELRVTRETGVSYPVVMTALNKEIAMLEAKLARLKSE